jgi:hypothetical protein
MEESGQLHASAVLPPGKSPSYPLDRMLGGLQSRSERGREKENSHPLPRLEPKIIQAVAQRYTTEIFRFFPVQGVLSNIWRIHDFRIIHES